MGQSFRTFEQKHSVSVFGHSISLDLSSYHSPFRKVTCSPDGYFLNKDNSLVLLEFKCNFKRKTVINRIPNHYRDQIQTGLVFSGESVNKGLYVDVYFRMCSLKQLEPSHAGTTGSLKRHPRNNFECLS